MEKKTLTELSGKDRGRSYTLTDVEVSIGRDHDCTIILANQRVSGRHARVFFTSGQYVVQDLDSRNGTFVNGHRIESQAALRHGDTIRIGHTQFGFGQRANQRPRHQDVGHQVTIAESGRNRRLDDGKGLRPDITERSDSERAHCELKASGESMGRSNNFATMGQLTAGVVHDLRAPMTVIKGYSDLTRQELWNLLGDRCTGSDTMRYLASIDEAVNHCSTIVERLLEFSNPVFDKKILGSVNDLAVEVREFLSTEILRRGVDFELFLEEALPMVRFEHSELKRVLINLVMNALQAMTEGGRLILRTAAMDQSGTRRVTVQVSDSGCGMSAEQQQRIFEPFFTLRRNGRKNGGTGLGLTICHNIVKNHGGQITVDSLQGRGTTFSISLPAQ